MKNFFKFLGIISMALVIGFSMAACDDGGGGGDGIEMSFVYWPMLGGSVRVIFDGGPVKLSSGTLASLVQDFELTIDGDNVGITKVGIADNYIDLGLNTDSYTNGTAYEISVTYEPNDARPIEYIESKKPLGAFTKTQNVKFEKN